MRTALVETIRGDQWVRRDTLTEWIRLFEEWNFEEIVFLGDDVLIHPEWWDIYEYASDDLRVETLRPMTTGQFLTRNDIMEMNEEPSCDPVIPVDFVEPISGRTYGENDYNQMIQNAINRLQTGQVWQGILETNLRNVQQIAMQSVEQPNVSWRGHLFDDLDLPEQFVGMIQEHELEVVDRRDWDWGHEAGSIPDDDIYHRDISMGRAQYAGVLHVDFDGLVSGINSEKPKRIWKLDRDSLADLTAIND